MQRKTKESNETILWQAVVDRIQRLFWDKKISASDLQNHMGWVVKRVLEYGSMEDVQTVIQWLGKERFLQLVSRLNFSSKRTERFWESMLELEGIECTKKSCLF